MERAAALVAVLLRSLAAPFTAPLRQWHPVIVHFPIVFLFVEAGLLSWYALSRREELERWTYLFLQLSFWSMLPVVIAGIHDSGLELGQGSPLQLGLQDRLKNAFNLQSTISVHVLLAFILLMTTGTRLSLRWRRGSVHPGQRVWLDLAVSALGLWIVTAAGYAGGLVSHA